MILFVDDQPLSKGFQAIKTQIRLLIAIHAA